MPAVGAGLEGVMKQFWSLILMILAGCLLIFGSNTACKVIIIDDSSAHCVKGGLPSKCYLCNNQWPYQARCHCHLKEWETCPSGYFE